MLAMNCVDTVTAFSIPCNSKTLTISDYFREEIFFHGSGNENRLVRQKEA